MAWRPGRLQRTLSTTWLRRGDPYSLLNDRRSPRGRAVALAEDASAGEIEAVIETAPAAGIPGAQQMLFWT